MLPESANSTFCMMASWSSSSTVPARGAESVAQAHWHMTRLVDQPVSRVVYNAPTRR